MLLNNSLQKHSAVTLEKRVLGITFNVKMTTISCEALPWYRDIVISWYRSVFFPLAWQQCFPPQQLQLGATVNTITALWRQWPRLQRVPVSAARDSDHIQIITMIQIHLVKSQSLDCAFTDAHDEVLWHQSWKDWSGLKDHSSSSTGGGSWKFCWLVLRHDGDLSGGPAPNLLSLSLTRWQTNTHEK